MTKAHTIIRMGAAHYDIRSSFGDQTATVDLAETLRDLPRAERIEKLTTAASVLTQLHDIRRKKQQPQKKQQAKRAVGTIAHAHPSVLSDSLQLAGM